MTSSMFREIVRIAPRKSKVTSFERSAMRSPTIVDHRAPGPRRCSSRCLAASSRASASFVGGGVAEQPLLGLEAGAHHRRDRSRVVGRARGGAGLGRRDDLVAELLDEHGEAGCAR